MNKEKLAAVDIEVLPNYFLVMFKGIQSGKVVSIETFGVDKPLSVEDRKRLHRILNNRTTFGFNSMRYDMPLIQYAISGAATYDLYNVSKDIIENNRPDWMTYRRLDIDPKAYDHFDIAEPAPAVMVSLKNYGTRIGSPRLQDFYLDPHEPIEKKDISPLKSYCENDLDVTSDLFYAIEDRIDLRIAMGETYGMDLRSKSDAQIAEAVITSELEKEGVRVGKPDIGSDYRPSYRAPAYISFESEQLQQLLHDVENISFELAANGAVKMPKELSNRKIVIGNTTYKMGIGGLHSQEKKLSVASDDRNVMRNADFASYYPFIILNNDLYPKHLGPKFLTVYRRIVETRLKAKAEGDKLVADSLKITINGSFGKFGSKYSKLYSPDMLLATTITGQLTLLMLIEQFEKHGIPVISANTDGLEYYCPRDKADLAETIIFDLELITGYEMEHGSYLALHAKDVNNYVAVYPGYVKAKGLYAETTLQKGRQTPVVFEAIRRYLLDGTPLDATITQCTDINGFVSARNVTGGAVYDGEYLGKVARWYYSTQSKGPITYKKNGNKVPKTDGAKPMMDLTADLPNDLDYGWYIDEAIDKLKDLGVN